MNWLSNMLGENSNFEQIFSVSGRIRRITIISAYLDFRFFNDFQKQILKNFDSRSKPEMEVFCDYHANFQWVEKYSADYDRICKRFQKKFSNRSKINFVSWGELFHPKCILIETNSGKSLTIGSGNFTNNGFNKNEELFINLSERFLSRKNKHLIEWIEREYIPRLREKTVFLSWKRKKQNGSTFREIILGGKIIFEAKIQDSLRFVLKLPDSVKDVPTDISPLLEAGLTDSISIERLIELTRNEPIQQEKTILRDSWKRLCIETCYGYWLPREHFDPFERIIEKKEGNKKLYYQSLLGDIKNLRIDIQETFLQECKKIDAYIRKNFPHECWDFYQPILSSGERLLSQKFSSWLARIEQKLENPEYVKRLAHGLLISPAPDYWSDSNACEEFLESIGNTIQFVAQRGGKMMNSPVSSVLRNIGPIDLDEPPLKTINRIYEWLSQNIGESLFSTTTGKREYELDLFEDEY